METYTFDDQKRSIRIHRPDLPAPWLNYLSNGHLHGFISQAAGGTLWMWDNPSRYRMTRYRQYNLPIDSPGFYLYLREEDGTVWSPSFRPTETKTDTFCAEHFPGKTVFHAEKDGTRAELTIFIAPDVDICVWNLELICAEEKQFDVFAYMEFSQYVLANESGTGYYWRHMLKTWYDETTDSMRYLFHGPVYSKEKAPLCFMASDRKLVSYSGNRDAFVGNYRDERNPISVERGICGKEEIQSGEPCGALHVRVRCEKGKAERVSFFVGGKEGGILHIKETETKIAEELETIRKPEARRTQEEKLDAFFEDFFGKFQCSVPDPAAERQINTWGPLASLHTARYSRNINMDAPGERGYGYRDTCQDMLAMTYRDLPMARQRLFDLMRTQYAEGCAIHGCPDVDGPAPRGYAIRCDDHLWTPFLAYSVLAESGDAAFLQKKIPYLARDNHSGEGLVTVWEHLLQAIRFTETNLGGHGLPLTYLGDWNDIIHKFSEKGRGESIFAAQQYVKALELMIEMADYLRDAETSVRMCDYRDKQKEAISACAWNGSWWYRCFDDEGNAIGSEADEFGKIWLNPQSWSVIGNVGTRAQQRQAMDAVRERLDTGIGVKLLAPGFETYPKLTDPFSSYNPGTGENGAVFCHAHTWAVIAEAILGNAEAAWKYYNDLVPHNALQKAGLERYRAEPYTWCSNIVGDPNNRRGWGNVSHISGTVPWMNVAATQYLLGIRPTPSGMVFDPCIPSDWDGFRVEREWRGCRLHIEADNAAHVQKGVKCLKVDGEELCGGFMPAEKIGGKAELFVKVIMG